MSEDEKNELKEKLAEMNLEKAFYLDNKSKGVMDALQETIVSRKLLVFITATVLMAWAQLDPDTWGMIAMCYIGGQTAVDFAKAWRNG